jgi:uncharacterized membrane protein YfcA
MELELTAWLVSAIAVLLTGISKSGLGGALGGLAVPLMSMWISPRDAAGVMLPILVLTDLVGFRAWRGKASMADLRLLVPASLVGILIGTVAFGMMSDRVVKGAIGLIAVAFTLDRVLRRRKPQHPAHAGSALWARLAGATSGVTSTLAHAGGPPMLAYLLGRGLPREMFVATTVYYFALINAAKLPFYVGLGLFTRDTLLTSLILAPLVPLGVWLGMRILRRIPERPFYLFATAALGLSGVQLLWSALG